MLKENYEEVQKKITEACKRAGRNREEVTLIAVSKTKPVEMLSEIYDLGERNFGENKVQELTEKEEVLPKDIHWHMIGHLQRNKVKYIIQCVTMIESVDRIELAQEIDRQAQMHGVVMPVLIQVNLAREEQKGGIYIEDYPALLDAASHLPGIKVSGLMATMPNVPDVETIRPLFREMRAMFDRERENARQGVDMRVLSMGMTHDYLVAVSEGATQVRLGHAIFD